MATAKRNTSEKTAAPGKKGKGAVTIVYKTKTSKSSFPEKIRKVNKLLSKAKLIK
jgi:hypothetical protein